MHLGSFDFVFLFALRHELLLHLGLLLLLLLLLFPPDGAILNLEDRGPPSAIFVWRRIGRRIDQRVD